MQMSIILHSYVSDVLFLLIAHLEYFCVITLNGILLCKSMKGGRCGRSV